MNPRQVALVIWATIAFLFMLSQRGIRTSLGNVLRRALSPRLLVPAIGGHLWNVAIIYGLFRLGFWNISMWWDTTAFILFGTVRLVWQMTSSNDYSFRFFARAVLATFGVTVLLGTVVSTYTFSLVWELLLVPWLALLGGLLAFARSSDKYRSVVKTSVFLLSVTGFAMAARAFVGAAADYTGFMSAQTVQSLLLLFVLTTAFIPCLFALRVYMTYENALVPLRLGEDKSNQVRWYAFKKIFLTFGLNLSRLHKFQCGPANRLRWATTRKAVDEVLERSIKHPYIDAK